MPTYLSGVTFANQAVSPSDDGSTYAALVADGITTGCTITAVGSTLHLAAGKLIACGRVIRVPNALDIAVTGITSGYARLVLTINLANSATASVFEQAYLDVETASSINGFSALTRQDINGSGTVYQMVLCLCQITSSAISEIISTCGPAHAIAKGVSVPLPANGWSSETQTVAVPGVTSATNIVVSPAPSSRDNYLASDIYMSAQGEGTVTFSCASAPSSDVTVNLLLA